MSQDLFFDIDLSLLEEIKDALEANEHQMLAAFNLAINRTAITMKKMASTKLQSEIQAKNLKLIKSRFQAFSKLKSTKKIHYSHWRELDELKLWFGLNDVRVGHLKGRIKKTGENESSFNSTSLGSQRFKGSRIQKRYGRRSIFLQNGRSSPEAKVALEDELQVMIEDDVFSQLTDVFMQHFETDLKGRVKTGMNQTGWRS